MSRRLRVSIRPLEQLLLREMLRLAILVPPGGALIGNGGRIGEEHPARFGCHVSYFDIPASMIRAGRNVLAVRIPSNSGSRGFRVPISIFAVKELARHHYESSLRYDALLPRWLVLIGAYQLILAFF